MNYRSTRNNTIIKKDKIALLQGLSEDGGLFVLENFNEKKIDLEPLYKQYAWCFFWSSYWRLHVQIATVLVDLQEIHIVEFKFLLPLCPK